MKTGKKIIITTLGIFIATLVGSLLLMRSDLQAIVDRGDQFQYAVEGLGEFDQVILGANYSAKIRQAREYKIEFIMEDSIYSPLVERKNGVIVLKRDSLLVINDQIIKVKITTPKLRSIEAGEGSTLNIQMMKLDSVDFTFGDNTTFIGVENKFYHSTIKTNGKTTFKVTDDPDV